MSFQLNNTHQMALHDPLLSLTERERKYLKDSWAETFSKKIFPCTEGDRFSVLYSANPASRPNKPVNVYWRSLTNHIPHTLHTTSFAEQPVSKNSLTNFRGSTI